MLKKIKENKLIKGIFKTIEIVFFACAILYVAFIVFQKVSNNASLFGYRTFTVVSESMIPVYKIGDVLFVKEVDTLKVGDDITYIGSGNFQDMIITHRIIDINEDEITTKGVANVLEDEPIKKSQVYGKVVGKSILITFISNIIRNQYGFFFLVFLPMVLIIFMEFVDIFHNPEEKEENE